MTSSATTSILSEKKNLDRLSHATRAYFQNRTKNRVHNLVLTKFRKERDAGRLTQAQLARRMGKTPDQISRILSYPSNLGLEMVSDLLLAIAGEELDATSSDPQRRPAANARSRAMLTEPPELRVERTGAGSSGVKLLMVDGGGRLRINAASSASTARPQLVDG